MIKEYCGSKNPPIHCLSIVAPVYSAQKQNALKQLSPWLLGELLLTKAKQEVV